MRAIIKYLPSNPVISHRTYSYLCIAALILIFVTIGKSACSKMAEANRKPSPIDNGISHG